MPKPLNFLVSENNTIVVSGVLDRNSVVKASLPKMAGCNVINLDLAQVSKVDTAGLAWLIDLLSQLQRNGIDLKLHNLPEQLVKLIGLGHVDNLFE